MKQIERRLVELEEARGMGNRHVLSGLGHFYGECGCVGDCQALAQASLARFYSEEPVSVDVDVTERK